ncbi:hypothetical protein POG07_16735, partial [Coprococcus comes]|nr:hypothetical protein [Coprococcus comes]
HVKNSTFRIYDQQLLLPERTGRQLQTQHIPCNMINCFCMYSNYQPLTLDEWIACDKNRKQKSCQNVK